jgi:hypothetical protein
MNSETTPEAEPKDQEPSSFEFWRTAYLVQALDFRARSLSQLLSCVTLVPLRSIFFHLHQRFFREPERPPAYPNDFAEWAEAMVGNPVVAERLANVNLFRSEDLDEVRREISVILAEHLEESGEVRTVVPEKAFIFCMQRMALFATGRSAKNPNELLVHLREVEIDSIAFHLFVPKMMRRGAENDFAMQLKRWGYSSLGEQLKSFDPYLNSLEDNRQYLIELIQAGI